MEILQFKTELDIRKKTKKNLERRQNISGDNVHEYWHLSINRTLKGQKNDNGKHGGSNLPEVREFSAAKL